MEKRTRCRRVAVCFLAVGAAGATSRAAAPATQAASAADTTRMFVVTPASPPMPALRYQFKFPREEQYDGNGVTSYLQAVVEMNRTTVTQINDLLSISSDDEFLRAIPTRMKWLNTRVPETVAAATHYRFCTFEWPARDRGVFTLLPYLNHVASTQNYLQLQARYATAKGDWRQAIELIRAMAIVADFSDDGDTFAVNNQVSVGAASKCVAEIQRLEQQPEAPNLYWAVRQLPMPFGNYAVALRNDSAMLEMTYPLLRQARDGTLSAAEWKHVLRQMSESDESFSNSTTRPQVKLPDPDSPDFVRDDLAAARLDYARRRDLAADDVDRFDPVQVTAAYYYDAYRDAADELTKWASVPYPQALPGIDRATRLRGKLLDTQSRNPFARLGLSSLQRVVLRNAQLDRTIAATAAVEAVRAYAAAHDGRPPAALADVVDTPVPDNPVTGKPFDYTVTGNVVVLSDSDTLAGEPLRYEIRLRD